MYPLVGDMIKDVRGRF